MKLYLKISDETHKVEQAGIYKNRRLVYQIDCGHSHGVYEFTDEVAATIREQIEAGEN